MPIRHKRLSTGLVLNLDGRTQSLDDADHAMLREAAVLRVDPSNACNAVCVFCESSFNTKGSRLPLEVFDQALADIAQSPRLNTLQFGCTFEPTIRKDFSEFGRLLEKHRFLSQPETLSIVSNCWILDRYDMAPFVRGGLNKLHVSLHAHERDTFEKVMGHDYLERVSQTLKRFKASHRHVVISAVCVVNTLNAEAPEDFARWAFHDVGVDYLRFTRAQIYGDRKDSPAKAALVGKPEGFSFELTDEAWLEFARRLEGVASLGLDLLVSKQHLKNSALSVDALRLKRTGAPNEAIALRRARDQFLALA